MIPDDARIFRMKRVQGTPASVEAGLRFFDEVVTECCQAVPGFRMGWFLVDRDNSRTVTLTLWADLASLNAATHGLAARVEADPEAAATVARINAGGVEFETYELARRSS
jgi:hypothetical protein